jgi:hypothetical protein
MREILKYPEKNNLHRFRFILLVILAGWMLPGLFPADGFSQEETKELAADLLEWETEAIADGIFWKQYRGDDLFDARLSINILEVDLEQAAVHYKIAHLRDELIKTSEFAEQSGALAAVNGSFFNMDAGGSVVFLKVDGEVIADGAVGVIHTRKAEPSVGMKAVLPQIVRKPEDGWHSVNLTNVMSSGPVLIYQNEIREFNNDPFNQNRHPRTAVAITDNNQLIMAAVDGRSFQSYGMTIPELAQFLQELGAVNALNLDGGGSTSMWIQEKNIDGIVNYPSDNLEFDHEGERGVSNALLLIAN